MTGHDLVEQELARQLQDSLDRVRRGDAPITLTHDQAVARAMKLRAEGLPYVWIAKVMGVYHGLWYSDSWWRDLCRAAGAPAKHYANGNLRVTPQMRKQAQS
jgi:hypothetical protein